MMRNTATLQGMLFSTFLISAKAYRTPMRFKASSHDESTLLYLVSQIPDFARNIISKPW